MSRKYDSVVKILNCEMIGCVNTNSEEEFSEICSSVNKYNCFEDTIYMALIEQLADCSKENSPKLCYDNIGNVSRLGKDYGWAFAVADVLFPAVLCLCERNSVNEIHQTRRLYAFRLMDEIDIQNFSDFFNPDTSKYLKERFLNCDMPSSEDVYRFIITSLFLLQF